MITLVGMDRSRALCGALSSNGGPELLFFKDRDDLLGDSAGQKHAAARHEDQCQIAGDPAEVGRKQGQGLRRDGIIGFQSGRGDLVGRLEGRLNFIRLADRPVEIDHAAAAQDLFGRNAALDTFNVRKNGEIALRPRAQIDVPALARDRYPVMVGIDQPGDAQTGSGAQDDARGVGIDLSSADFVPVLLVQRGGRQGLRLGTVETDHVLQEEVAHHLFGANDPGAVRQAGFIAVDRSGNGKNRRTGLHRGLVEHTGLNGFFNGFEIGGRENRKFLRLRIGIHENGETRIGSADVADQDREMNDCFLVHDIGHVP